MRSRILCLTIAGFLSTGCSYLAHVTKGQIAIMNKAEPISSVLKQGRLSSADQEKLKLILEIRDFSSKALGLTPDGSYLEYVDLSKLRRDAVAYNLVVCPKDRLEPHTWWFPFIGRIGYLGFFDREYAFETKKEYEEEGYDTYLRAVSAYSTLGWFDDPIFSSMLSFRQDQLANLIIHELTHATIYKSGDTLFNEGIATFIGNKGSIAFMVQKYGEQSKQRRDALDAQHDDLLFSKYIEKAKKRLDQFYSQPLTKEEKVERREKEFHLLRNDFIKLKAAFKTKDYEGFERIIFNNAVFAGLEQYYGDLSLYEKIWEIHHRRFVVMIDIFKRAEAEEDSIGYLKKIANHK